MYWLIVWGALLGVDPPDPLPGAAMVMVQAAPVSTAADGVATFVPVGFDGLFSEQTSRVVHVVDCRSTHSVIPVGGVQVRAPPAEFSAPWNVSSRSFDPHGTIDGAVVPVPVVDGATCFTAPARPEAESQPVIRRIAPTESELSCDTV